MFPVGGGDGGDSDSAFIPHLGPRLPGSGAFSVGNLPLSGIGEQNMFGGQLISPTHPQGPLQYMQPQVNVQQCIKQPSICSFEHSC